MPCCKIHWLINMCPHGYICIFMTNLATSIHLCRAARVPSFSCCCSCSGRSEPDLAPEWKEAVSEVTSLLTQFFLFKDSSYLLIVINVPQLKFLGNLEAKTIS